MRPRLFALLAALSFVLAACGGSGGSDNSGHALPKVTGGFGATPTVTYPSSGPPAGLHQKVLERGHGAVLAKGDLLVANYLGQIWRGKVFDSSFSRKQPIAVQIGMGQVIPGWDKTLVGARVGSRLLLVIPPADGYGSKGNSQAGISGTDTLVFVVDVLGAYGKNASAGSGAVPQTVPAGLPEVEGTVGQPPVVVIPKGTKQPTKQQTVVVALGSGTPVRPGLLVLQYEAVDWTGKVLESTWASGAPVGEPVGTNTSQSGALDSLVGVPLGSRVLILFPSQTASGAAGGQTGSYAVVADLIAQPSTQ